MTIEETRAEMLIEAKKHQAWIAEDKLKRQREQEALRQKNIENTINLANKAITSAILYGKNTFQIPRGSLLDTGLATDDFIKLLNGKDYTFELVYPPWMYGSVYYKIIKNKEN